MKKFNRKGFSTIEGVLLVVIVAIVVFVVWYVFHAKNNTNSIYGSAANTSTTVPSAKKSATKTSPTSSSIIQTKTDSKLGKYLADGNGKPLYTYSKDTDNTSNCTGTCLTSWPAYKATASSASLPANVGTITRADGTVQYTYNKKPLYYFTGDTSNTITGNGIDGFNIATP